MIGGKVTLTVIPTWISPTSTDWSVTFSPSAYVTATVCLVRRKSCRPTEIGQGGQMMPVTLNGNDSVQLSRTVSVEENLATDDVVKMRPRRRLAQGASNDRPCIWRTWSVVESPCCALCQETVPVAWTFGFVLKVALPSMVGSLINGEDLRLVLSGRCRRSVTVGLVHFFCPIRRPVLSSEQVGLFLAVTVYCKLANDRSIDCSGFLEEAFLGPSGELFFYTLTAVF